MWGTKKISQRDRYQITLLILKEINKEEEMSSKTDQKVGKENVLGLMAIRKYAKLDLALTFPQYYQRFLKFLNSSLDSQLRNHAMTFWFLNSTYRASRSNTLASSVCFNSMATFFSNSSSRKSTICLPPWPKKTLHLSVSWKVEEVNYSTIIEACVHHHKLRSMNRVAVLDLK